MIQAIVIKLVKRCQCLDRRSTRFRTRILIAHASTTGKESDIAQETMAETDFGQIFLTDFGHPKLADFGQTFFGPMGGLVFWGSEGWDPEGGVPKIPRFFIPFPPPFRSFCVSLGVFSWNVGGVWKRRGRQMCTFGVLRLLCEAPAAPNATQQGVGHTL